MKDRFQAEYRGVEAHSLLHRLEMDADRIRQSVASAQGEVDSFTDNDVAGRGGFTMWAATLRNLRDQFATDGFKSSNERGFETLRSPDDIFQVAVAPGSPATGTEAMPITRLDRGPLTQQAVEMNRHQLRLDEQKRVKLFTALPEPKIWTWLLLHYTDRVDEEIRIELSLPLERGKLNKENRCQLTGFEPRVILEPVDLDQSNEGTQEAANEIDDVDDIDVKIRRKA